MDAGPDAAADREPRAAPFGLLVRRHRLALGLSQEALAERAGISARSLSEIERGGPHRPRRDTVALLADALGLDESERAALERALPRQGTAPAPVTPSLGAEDGAPTPPPLPAADTPAWDNLPVALSSFIGRERELTEVRALLETARLVTLTGAGGAGKTRLALAVAAALEDQYADRVWLVELAALAEPALAPGAVAQTLGLREQPGRPMQDTLVAYLRERQLLLVLDNCEHLLAACAALAGALLRACPHLHLLATSRAGLGLAGEHLYRVPSLRVPAPHDPPSPELAESYEAVRLFVTRARERRAGFALTDQNVQAVAQVCARLDGLPLAIELAAARVGALSVETIAARLDDRFALLRGGARDALPRQQTLRATLDWSYELLGEGERVLLRRLSVFAGGWTLAAAEAVCADDGIAGAEVPAGAEIDEGGVLDLLEGLVHKSLVQADEAAAGELRYGLLETIREYAVERLEESGETEVAVVRQRHAAYYLALVEEAAPYLNGPEELAWLAQLDAELDNVRATLRWFLERGASAEGVRIATALHRAGGYWHKRNALAEGYSWLTQLLALPNAAPDVGRVRALIVAGRAALVQGEATAQQRLNAALALGRRLGDCAGVAQALLWLGVLATRRGDDRQARVRLDESLALFRALGDAWSVTEALCHLSRALTRSGEPVLAQAHMEEALTIARAAGERRHMAFVLELRGEVAFTQGEDAEAGRLWQESLACYREISIGVGIVTVENFLGQLALRQGDPATARVRFAASLADHQTWSSLFWSLGALAGLAAVAAVEGQAARALRLAGASAALGEAAGLRLPVTEREAVERAISSARAMLDARQADAEWATGQALPLDQAVAYALEPPASGYALPDGTAP